jgi:hypothetical protein
MCELLQSIICCKASVVTKCPPKIEKFVAKCPRSDYISILWPLQPQCRSYQLANVVFFTRASVWLLSLVMITMWAHLLYCESFNSLFLCDALFCIVVNIFSNIHIYVEQYNHFKWAYRYMKLITTQIIIYLNSSIFIMCNIYLFHCLQISDCHTLNVGGKT